MTNTLNYEELVAQVAALTKRCEALFIALRDLKEPAGLALNNLDRALRGMRPAVNDLDLAKELRSALQRARAALESNDGGGS